MATEKRPVLLFGAYGLLGAAIRAQLEKENIPVRIFIRADTRHEDTGKGEYVQGDVTTGNGLAEAVSGVSAVLFFIRSSVPAVSANNPALDFSTTLPPLLNVLNALANHNPRAQFIFPSTGGSIYGDSEKAATEQSPVRPMSAYALGKLIAEETLRFYDRVFCVRSTILRISNVYGGANYRNTPQGVIDCFLDNALRGDVSQIWGTLDVERDYVFVDDVARATAMLAERHDSSTAIYNVGQSKSTSIREVLEIIDRVTDGRHRYEFSAHQYPGIQRSRLDCSLLDHDLAWRPSVSLDEGIEKTWLRKNWQAKRIDAACPGPTVASSLTPY
jgi:UDP-glucose 4-epimerase